MDVIEAPDPSVPAVSVEDIIEPTPSMIQSLVITSQEVFALTSVLARLSQAMISQPSSSSTANCTFNVIEDPPQSPTRNLIQQEPMQGGSPDLENPNTYSSCEETQISRGKRRRPKYSLTPHVVRKHAVLKFFATGQMDRSKTPYKWWCRVCRVELSLMSWGVLELLSHFKTDAT